MAEISDKMTIDIVYTSAYLTGTYLVKEFEDNMSAKILVIGEEGLKDELKNHDLMNAELLKPVFDGEESYDISITD